MRELFLIILFGLLVGIALAVAVSNYIECRRAGFSMIYCTTSHVLR